MAAAGYTEALTFALVRTDIIAFPVNARHLYNICTMLAQRRRHWADIVQMLYKCFAFARLSAH